MKDFKKLNVWLKAHQLALSVYRNTSAFPVAEKFGLTSQLRRSASSIPANIAEGCGRGGDAELARFLRIAAGSTNELEYHLLLSRDLSLLSEDKYTAPNSSVKEVRMMLSRLLDRLKAINDSSRNAPR